MTVTYCMAHKVHELHRGYHVDHGMVDLNGFMSVIIICS